jgi:hypothetical protein
MIKQFHFSLYSQIRISIGGFDGFVLMFWIQISNAHTILLNIQLEITCDLAFTEMKLNWWANQNLKLKFI